MDLNRTRLLSNDITNQNGHRHLRATLGTLAAVVVVLLAASSASAATLNVVGGQLLGASGVIVDGSSYNVEFLNGTCIALYDGCDDVSDFTFQTESSASLASRALLDQVFLDGADLFDTDPELTAGCSDILKCNVATPYAYDPSQTLLRQSFASNRADSRFDQLVNFWHHLGNDHDYGGVSSRVYAVWSPVPEPGTAVLMGLGLFGLSVRKRRDGRNESCSSVRNSG